MFKLQDILVPICPASPTPTSMCLIQYSSLSIAPLDKVSCSPDVLAILSLFLFCFALYSLATEVIESSASSNSKSFVTLYLYFNDLDEDENEIDESPVVLVHKIAPLILDDCSPDNQMNFNLYRIDPVQNTAIIENPCHWYLRRNLSDQEIESLNYSEKARRFYHLTKFSDEFSGDFVDDFQVVQLYHEPERIPMKLLSDSEWINRCRKAVKFKVIFAFSFLNNQKGQRQLNRLTSPLQCLRIHQNLLIYSWVLLKMICRCFDSAPNHQKDDFQSIDNYTQKMSLFRL